MSLVWTAAIVCLPALSFLCLLSNYQEKADFQFVFVCNLHSFISAAFA